MTALPTSGTFTMVDPSHVAAVGPAAAILFARIAWRAQNNGGEWSATRRDLSNDTGLSLPSIRTASEVLRAKGWVTARRTSTLVATLIWAPVFAGQAERRNPPSRDGVFRTTPPAESAISSLETGNTYTSPLRVVGPHEKSEPVDRPEVVALCELLADRIEGNGSKRPTVSKAWLSSCRLLIDKDGRSAEQVGRAIEWCQADEFWKGNVLSMPTLRKQYDRLRLAAQRDGGRTRAPIPAPDEAYDPAHAAALPPPPPRSLYA